MAKKFLVVFSLIAAVVIAGAFTANAQSGGSDSGDSDDLAPLEVADDAGIEDEYIVVLKQEPGVMVASDATAEVAEAVTEADGEVDQVLTTAISGLIVTADEAALEEVRANPNVAYVVQNSRVELERPELGNALYTWGRDRINQRDLPLDQNVEVIGGGAGVDVYVLDTGIAPGHVEFAGRNVTGHSVFPDDPWDQDCDGHGTHVAGTAAGSTVGVATESNIISVRVFNCEVFTTQADVLEAIDWVAQRIDGPSVVNMSFGWNGARIEAVDTAVANLVDRGAVATVAAMNARADACGSSPVDDTALIVASSTEFDTASSFTNWGPCVDLYAPGSDVLSADSNDPAGYLALSGTSMAAPHTAGAAAIYWARNPGLTSNQVHDALVAGATTDAITDGEATTPNRLLYVEPEPASVGSVITVRARGDIGTETIALEVNGAIVTRFELSTAYETFTYRLSDDQAVEGLRVIFDNDYYEPGVGDKNINVDYAEIDGRRIETEDPGVRSSGVWDGSSCGERFAQSERMQCNGWFDYLYQDGGGDDGQIVEVRAQGAIGSESIAIEVNGQIVSRHTLGTVFETITYQTDGTALQSLRVIFDNDQRGPDGDRNVRVDYITIDGQRFETEAPTVSSIGPWADGTCRAVRYIEKEWLVCNGWFDYTESFQ